MIGHFLFLKEMLYEYIPHDNLLLKRIPVVMILAGSSFPCVKVTVGDTDEFDLSQTLTLVKL